MKMIVLLGALVLVAGICYAAEVITQFEDSTSVDVKTVLYSDKLGQDEVITKTERFGRHEVDNAIAGVDKQLAELTAEKVAAKIAELNVEKARLENIETEILKLEEGE